MQNLKHQLTYRINDQQTVADVFPAQARNITESLARVIVDDYNFVGNPRDAGFAYTVVDRWEDYRAYLRSDKHALDFIMHKIIRALTIHHDKHPRYFEGLDYDADEDNFLVWFPEKDEEPIFVAYLALEAAFSRHLEIAEHDGKLREKYVRLFQEALCNKKLTQNTFKTSFDDLGKCSR